MPADRGDAAVLEAGRAHHPQASFDELVSLALARRQLEQLLCSRSDSMRTHTEKGSFSTPLSRALSASVAVRLESLDQR